MNTKNLVKMLGICGALMMILVPLTAMAGNVDMDSEYATTPPTIDGVLSEAEWENAVIEEYSYDNDVNDGTFVVGFLNDETYLYAFADLTFLTNDTRERTTYPFWFAMYIDTDNNEELNYTYIADADFEYEDTIIFIGNDDWGINTDGGSVAMGYMKTWNEDDVKHTVVEFSIPLANIGYDDIDDFDEPMIIGFGGSEDWGSGFAYFTMPEDSDEYIELTLAEPIVVTEDTSEYTENYVVGYLLIGAFTLFALGSMQLLWLNKPFEQLAGWQQWIMMNDRYLMFGIGACVLVFSHFVALDFIGQYAYDIKEWIHGLIGY